MINDDPKIVQDIMSRCLIIEAEASFVSDAIEYVAICSDFLEVKEGEILPIYELYVENYLKGEWRFVLRGVDLRKKKIVKPKKKGVS